MTFSNRTIDATRQLFERIGFEDSDRIQQPHTWNSLQNVVGLVDCPVQRRPCSLDDGVDFLELDFKPVADVEMQLA